jgi:hydroxymethylglutaryl-CoA lyase
MEAITWIECPRDAMQGYATVFRTEDKIAYLRRLMAVGFDCLDLASFVSPKSIPQMFDSVQVLDALAPDKGLNTFLVIAANSQGIDAALAHEAVDAVGVPFSLSEQFQIRNTKRSQEHALDDWSASMDRLHVGDKQLVV